MKPTYHWLGPELTFPDPACAGSEGLVALGGDLSVQRLILAYRHGIFPWYSRDQPILWWSPDPRCVLVPERFKCARALVKSARKMAFSLRMNTQFTQVIRLCAQVPRPGQDGTWITEEMIAGYGKLHQKGWAHSLEVYQEERLVGGLYGLAMGAFFFGESMFSLVPDASKFALWHLSRWMRGGLIDCQVPNPHLLSLGAETMPRVTFLKLLKERIDEPRLFITDP